MIDTVKGADASAVLYSITETAKTNNLKIYDYLVYLLSELPKYIHDLKTEVPEHLYPWSENFAKNLFKEAFLTNQCISGKTAAPYPGLCGEIADLSMSISYEYTKSLIKRLKNKIAKAQYYSRCDFHLTGTSYFAFTCGKPIRLFD